MNLWNVLCGSFLAASLHVNDRAPDFIADDCDGRPQALAKLVQKGPVVLAFFPKAFTPGCTKELRAFADNAARWRRHNVSVVAISADKPGVLQKFRTSLGADYTFIPDGDGRLMQLYGVRSKLLPFASRTTFVIDRRGTIASIHTGQDAVQVQGAFDVIDRLGDP